MGILSWVLIVSAIIMVLLLRSSAATGRLSCGATSRYPGFAGEGRICGGCAQLFSISGFVTTSSIDGCLSAGVAGCSRPYCCSITGVLLASSPGGVSIAVCASAEDHVALAEI